VASVLAYWISGVALERRPGAGPAIVLFSRSGFALELAAEAAGGGNLTLVDLEMLVSS
jgi:hypothetical protein